MGRVNHVSEEGDQIKERIPAEVRISVTITIGITPSHSARTPQTNFPTAPPAKRRVSAKPT